MNHKTAELDLNNWYYPHCKAGARLLKLLGFLRLQGLKYVKDGITGMVG
ncbi:MAG: hypothetical protein WDM80_11975 [Limisphaerales bacterium]